MTDILWQGHEADAYVIANSNNTEDVTAISAPYERAGMRAGKSASGSLKSTPDWPARDEIWHRFNHNNGGGGYSAGEVFWAAENAAGTQVARIVQASSTTAQYQVSDGAGAWINVGAAFLLQGSNLTTRFDIHHKGGGAGQVEVWYGTPGAQTKVVDETGSYASAVSIVRIFHGPESSAGGFWTTVAFEIVQTTSTLSSTSEIKPPTSNGADVDGTGTYADVDEQVYSDVDFITLSAAGERQSFKAAARTQSQTVVTGVTASCRAWYEAGGPTHLKPYLTIAGVRYYGTTFALDLVARGYQYTWGTNPATGDAFTAAEANAATLEWGWEAVA
jgi:hypothetical protein